MKNRNPYLSCIVLWIIVIFINLTACVLGVLNGILWQAFFNLAIVIIDCIFLGWCICKFNAYRNYIESTKSIEKTLKEFEKFIKMAENEPFKEFEDVDNS